MSEESNLLETLTSLLADSKTEEVEKVEEKPTENTESPIDLEMVLKLGSMFSDFSQDDDRARLLRDLKPFLSSEKRDKVDSAIKILKLLKIAEKAKNENLF